MGRGAMAVWDISVYGVTSIVSARSHQEGGWKRAKYINQLSGKGVDLRRVASLVPRLHRVSSLPARIPLKYCNLLICLFTGVSNSFSDVYSKLN